MASGSLMVILAGACFLLAALALARGWRIGAWLAAAGAAILAGALAARGLRAGHWPLTSQHEFALAFALGITLAVLVPALREGWSRPPVQAAAMLVAALLVAYARFVLPLSKQGISSLPPALESVWLPLHVGVAALAYGALALGGAAGLGWLLRDRLPGGGDGSRQRETGWLLDRAIAAGFCLLTLSMIFGMIWAEVAWGRYWGWDLKEVWTLVTWLVYALYWHARRRPGWQGRRLAWLAVIGLASVLFTFLGVGWLARAVGLESLHLF
jgi:ABC-type transport system involved in cytochrome c biogenesis permease subunit